MYRFKFEIDYLPDLPNARSQRSFWRLHNEKKNWLKYLFSFADKRPKEPLKKCEITMTRCSSRECDLDNLYASLKAPLDALVKAGFIFDDKPSICTLIAKWEKSTQANARMIIEIKELAASAE